MITGAFLFVGICIYTVAHALKRSIEDGEYPPIFYPIFWVLIIALFIALFFFCSC